MLAKCIFVKEQKHVSNSSLCVLKICSEKTALLWCLEFVFTQVKLKVCASVFNLKEKCI